MTLEILVAKAEDDFLEQKIFAELSIVEAPSPKLSVKIIEDWRRYSNEISEHYTPAALAILYMETLQKIHNLFQKKMSHKWDWKTLLQALLKAEFVYASPKAYQLIRPVIPKEKEDDQEINPIAHYNNYEIIVSLPEHANLETIKAYNFHELGHYFHHIDAPENYASSDATIKEAAALLVEKEQGINNSYASHTPHGRANELLKKANENKFKGKPFIEKWKILTEFYNHQDFEDYLNEKLFIFTSIAGDFSKHF